MASPSMLLNLFVVSFLAKRTFAWSEIETLSEVGKILWSSPTGFTTPRYSSTYRRPQLNNTAFKQCCVPVASHVQSRILYGDDTKIENYPFYAGLANCGAAIISSTWVLTAAHCVADIRTKSGYVWVGGESFANSIKVPYNKVIVHEQYKKVPITMNDVAVIGLATPLKFSKKIQPIKLPTKLVTKSKVAFVGRGRDETGKVSTNLKKLDLIKLTTEQCVSLLPQQYQTLVKPVIKVLEVMTLCAKRAEDKPSVCDGDSGSPLFSGDQLVGLASYTGRKRCSELRLGFYVNVTSYVPWIKSVTGL